MFQNFENVRMKWWGLSPPIILFLHIYLIIMHTRGSACYRTHSRESTIGQKFIMLGGRT